jgi:DNA-binding MarR family transcriptional regulator
VKSDGYSLDDQIGFVLRRAMQRHLAIFSEAIPGLTNRQFAALARLAALGPLAQNQLGRVAAMDAATIKGVVDRLRRQGLVATAADPDDGRRLVVRLTGQGQALFDATRASALAVSERTLAPLTPAERGTLMALLARIG